MATLGTMTPEWDPPYDTGTILDVHRERAFDPKPGGPHVWAGVSKPSGRVRRGPERWGLRGFR